MTFEGKNFYRRKTKFWHILVILVLIEIRQLKVFPAIPNKKRIKNGKIKGNLKFGNESN
ncbi:hypothetical protein BH24ACI2_BH24ACI2_06460 [soil metagenome]|jgi:hypothetical protein